MLVFFGEGQGGEHAGDAGMHGVLMPVANGADVVTLAELAEDGRIYGKIMGGGAVVPTCGACCGVIGDRDFAPAKIDGNGRGGIQ